MITSKHPSRLATMSHKQSNSPSAIPFSWEMIPGVPKQLMASPAAGSGGGQAEVSKNTLAPPPPPPPGSFHGPMRRSVSCRVFWREEDPFLAALKECTKDYKVKGDSKRRFGIWGSKSKSFLWCRCSFDVEEGNLRGRARTLSSSRGSTPVIIPPERVQGLRK